MGISTRHPRPELLAFVEGRLDQPARARVDQHLASCPDCRAEVFELMQLTDTLSALPAALHPLSARPADSWSQVWARVQGAPIRPLSVVPQLNLYLSLATVIFVLAAALPAGLGAQPLPVTAGVIQTPVAQATPVAGKATAGGAGHLGTALASERPVTAARPIPIQTPIPGQKG